MGRADQGGLLSELTSELAKILEMYAIPTRMIAVSAVTMEGFQSLYTVIHEVFCACGDLT